jgi:hypothetical protein
MFAVAPEAGSVERKYKSSVGGDYDVTVIVCAASASRSSDEAVPVTLDVRLPAGAVRHSAPTENAAEKRQ